MVKVKEDMTGWVMREHGVSDSRLIVLERVEDKGRHSCWLCQCSCGSKPFVSYGYTIRNGYTKSCGCLSVERSKKYNKFEICGDIVKIKLSNCDEYTSVNLDKWNEISYIRDFCWHKHENGYAEAVIPVSLRNTFGKKHIRLHQLICPCESGFEPDHLDRNRLNNCTNNLISKTRQENAVNRGLSNKNTTGVLGVIWSDRVQRFIAQIGFNGERIYIGYYKNLDDAIRARLNKEVELYGYDNSPQRRLFEQYGITQQVNLSQVYTNNIKDYLKSQLPSMEEVKQDFLKLGLTDEEAQGCANNINIYI